MIVNNLPIDGLKLIIPEVFTDERGYFFESYNKQAFNTKLKLDHDFIQDNHSMSKKGVLRGLHYQKNPFEQGKLIRVISGEIYDVALDLRSNSPTFGKWHAEILSSINKKQFWIPRGFAHGFLTLTDSAEVAYKTDNVYSRDHEVNIPWNSNKFSIKWPDIGCSIITSTKDRGIIE
jgi:dTDP-4-dehydrorhamnose 3,5-epimerase